MQKKEADTRKPTSARLLKNRPEDPDPVRGAIIEMGKDAPVEKFTKEEPKQGELLADKSEAVRPEPVQNGRLLATYIGLGLERDKDNEKLVHLDFSFPLEKPHEKIVPKRVRDAWEWLKASDNPLVQVGNIPAVTLGIYLDPQEKKPLFKITGAEFAKAMIQIVEETGKGKSKLVTRFKFRLRFDRSDDAIEFAAWHDGEEFWLRMEPTQKELDL
jgi:hypothetical protein